jgi:hypothetical protein
MLTVALPGCATLDSGGPDKDIQNKLWAAPAAELPNPQSEPSPPSPRGAENKESPDAPQAQAHEAHATGAADGSWEIEKSSWWDDTLNSACLRGDRDFCLMKEDYWDYYGMSNLASLAIGVGIAAPLANTSADQSIRDWYQRRIRGETTDEFAQVIEYAGQLWLVLPVGMEMAAMMGKTDADSMNDGGMQEWSNRSLRAVLVGSPLMVAMYGVLGSSRPDRHDSHWDPFNDFHGVSGHTFMGAVPFLTAAAMTDNIYCKIPLVAGSFLTGWARLNDDKHYFSQALLGWWMACCSVHCVSDTQNEHKSYQFGPTLVGDGPGVALQILY